MIAVVVAVFCFVVVLAVAVGDGVFFVHHVSGLLMCRVSSRQKKLRKLKGAVGLTIFYFASTHASNVNGLTTPKAC